MRLRNPCCLFVLLLWSAAPFASAHPAIDLSRTLPVPAGEPIPVMDFFRPALLERPKLNRAGTRIAAIVNGGEDRKELMVYNLDDKSVKILGSLADMEIYYFTWLDDERLLYMVSTEKLWGLGMLAVPVDHIHDSYPLLQYYGATLIGIPERNRLRPIVWMRSDFMNHGMDLGVAEIRSEANLGKMINLWTVDESNHLDLQVQDSNERHIVKHYDSPNVGIPNGYAVDNMGELAFAFTGDADGFLTVHHYEGKKWVKSPLDLEKVDFLDAGDRPGEAIIRDARQEGKPRAVRRVDVDTGKLGEVLVQDERYDFDGSLYRDDLSRQLVGAFYERAAPQAVWFDEGYRSAQKLLDKSFPGLVVRILNGDKTGRLLVATYSDRQPPIYSWVNLPKRSAGLIKNSAPWIDPARMQPMRMIHFKTRDHHVLDAYITLPAGASKQNKAPMVVLPHGGPWVRDSWGFDGEVQFLASRGYAVLQPNYRGSTGYDWMFPEEERYDFIKMSEDVTDATKLMIASGYIDPGRVAIMGGSFGGYLALSGVVHEPSLYRCAVTISGVFDYEALLKNLKYDQYSSSSYAYMKRKLGDPKTQKEKYDAMAPVRHVDQIRVPVFVSHGKEDRVVDVSESRRLIGELEKHHVPHEAMIVSGEGHGMSYLKDDVELYTRIEAFLAKNMTPVSAAPVSP